MRCTAEVSGLVVDRGARDCEPLGPDTKLWCKVRGDLAVTFDLKENAGWHSSAIMASTNLEIWDILRSPKDWRLRASSSGAACAVRGTP